MSDIDKIVELINGAVECFVKIGKDTPQHRGFTDDAVHDLESLLAATLEFKVIIDLVPLTPKV